MKMMSLKIEDLEERIAPSLVTAGISSPGDGHGPPGTADAGLTTDNGSAHNYAVTQAPVIIEA